MTAAEVLAWLAWAVEQDWCLRVVFWPKASQGYALDIRTRPNHKQDNGTFCAKTLEACIIAARAVFGGPE